MTIRSISRRTSSRRLPSGLNRASAFGTERSRSLPARCTRIDGRLVPARLFRGRPTPNGPVDEMLVDVDTWHPDTRGMLDRAIRFPLDSDLEEISDAAASEIFAMVARREYTPLTRR